MKVLKLNYRRTFLIGFAFFGILLLWQVYDSWCPTFLTDIFANNMYGLTSAELFVPIFFHNNNIGEQLATYPESYKGAVPLFVRFCYQSVHFAWTSRIPDIDQSENDGVIFEKLSSDNKVLRGLL